MNEKKNSGEQDDTYLSRHSRKTYLSFGMYQFTWTIIVSSQNLFLFFFYHTVLGLEPWLIFLATAITTVWASLNDPIIGFLTDRNFRWTRKWGRRFPWIVVGAIPWALSFILFFAPPNIDPAINPAPVFLWLIMALLVTDTFMTLADVNVSTLRADKFRSVTERRKYSGYFAPLDMLAQVVGMTLPPLLVSFATGKAGYFIMAILVGVIALIFALLFLPGAREDNIIIERYYSRDYKRMNIFKGVWEAIKQRSYLAFIISYTSFSVATTIMTAMVIYVTTFLLRTSADIMTVLLALFLIGALISVPLWLKLVKKFNDSKKVYTFGSFILCIALIPLSFFQSLIDLSIFMFIAGLAIGSIWTLGIPVILSNVQDDYVVRTGKNQKGVLIGTWAIFGLVTAFIDELIISTVFGITGFAAGYDTYEKLITAVSNIEPILWGIRFLLGVIPMLILLVGTITFWKFFPLDHQQVLKNREKLKELGF